MTDLLTWLVMGAPALLIGWWALRNAYHELRSRYARNS